MAKAVKADRMGFIPLEPFKATLQDAANALGADPRVSRVQRVREGSLAVEFRPPPGLYAPVAVVRFAPGSARGWEADVLGPTVRVRAQARAALVALMRQASVLASVGATVPTPAYGSRAERRAARVAAHKAATPKQTPLAEVSSVTSPLLAALVLPATRRGGVMVRRPKAHPRMERPRPLVSKPRKGPDPFSIFEQGMREPSVSGKDREAAALERLRREAERKARLTRAMRLAQSERAEREAAKPPVDFDPGMPGSPAPNVWRIPAGQTASNDARPCGETPRLRAETLAHLKAKGLL